jgi:hypothetical protein
LPAAAPNAHPCAPRRNLIRTTSVSLGRGTSHDGARAIGSRTISLQAAGRTAKAQSPSSPSSLLVGP